MCVCRVCLCSRKKFPRWKRESSVESSVMAVGECHRWNFRFALRRTDLARQSNILSPRCSRRSFRARKESFTFFGNERSRSPNRTTRGKFRAASCARAGIGKLPGLDFGSRNATARLDAAAAFDFEFVDRAPFQTSGENEHRGQVSRFSAGTMTRLKNASSALVTYVHARSPAPFHERVLLFCYRGESLDRKTLLFSFSSFPLFVEILAPDSGNYAVLKLRFQSTEFIASSTVHFSVFRHARYSASPYNFLTRCT